MLMMMMMMMMMMMVECQSDTDFMTTECPWLRLSKKKMERHTEGQA